MATGGAPDPEDELCSFELFECSVCMESLMTKQPRLLPCVHTFCTPCLQQIATRDILSCPKCRTPTKLPPDGVATLPKNTDLGKMKERELELTARNENLCQMCQIPGNKAEYICTTCPKRLICQACFKRHKIIAVLKSHQVLPLEVRRETEKAHEKCGMHGEILDFFCLECKEGLCVVCICGPEHAEHDAKIVNYQSGLQVLKQSNHNMHEILDENVHKVEICAKILTQEMDSLRSAKQTVAAKCQNLEAILNELRNKLTDLTKLEQPMYDLYQEVTEHCKEIRGQREEMDNLSKLKDTDYIIQSKEWHKASEQLMSITSKILGTKFKMARYLPDSLQINGNVHKAETIEKSLKDTVEVKIKESIQNRGETKLLKEQTMKIETIKSKAAINFKPDIKQELSLPQPELVLEIRPRRGVLGYIWPGSGVEMKDPRDVISVGDGTVILVDRELSYVQRVNGAGKVVRKYSIDKGLIVESACVYEGQLFIVSSRNTITKMGLDGSGAAQVFKPEGIRSSNIYIHVAATGANVLLISEYTHRGRILEYNTKTNKTTQKVSDIDRPGKVCVAQSDQNTKYIVTYYHRASDTRRVNIYDWTWRLMTTIDNMEFPRGVTVTPGGKMLIADWGSNRVVEYSLDGSRVKDLLGPDNNSHLYEPWDTAYHSPNMWVVQRYPHHLTMFQVDQ